MKFRLIVFCGFIYSSMGLVVAQPHPAPKLEKVIESRLVQTTKAPDPMVLFEPCYEMQLPIGGQSSIYGLNQRAGMAIGFKTNTNWTFEIEGGFIFGADVKDKTTFGSMVFPGGFVLNKNASIEFPSLEGRGFDFFLQVGKIFPLGKKNANSGLHLKLGGGYYEMFTHTNADGVSIVQLSDRYQSGYYHAMGGFRLSQFVGYTFFSKDKYLNFTVGLENMFAFTSSLNTWDFAYNQSLEGKKTTFISIGPKASIIIPIYMRTKKYFHETYYTN